MKTNDGRWRTECIHCTGRKGSAEVCGFHILLTARMANSYWCCVRMMPLFLIHCSKILQDQNITEVQWLLASKWGLESSNITPDVQCPDYIIYLLIYHLLRTFFPLLILKMTPLEGLHGASLQNTLLSQAPLSKLLVFLNLELATLSWQPLKHNNVYSSMSFLLIFFFRHNSLCQMLE